MTSYSHPALELLALPGFCLHSIWLFFVFFVIIKKSGHDLKALPGQLRAVLYLDVLNVDQEQAARNARDHEAEEPIKRLREAEENLEKAMQDVVMQERSERKLSARRRAEEVDQLEKDLTEITNKVGTIFANLAMEGDSDAVQELRKAEKLLQRLKSWKKAPEVLAHLESLRQQAAQSWLETPEKRRLEMAYEDFLNRCHNMDLGVAIEEEDEGSDEEEEDGVSSRTLVALPVDPEEHLHLRLEYGGLMSHGTTADEVWLSPGQREIQHSAPKSNTHRRTSFASAISMQEQWRSESAPESRISQKRQAFSVPRRRGLGPGMQDLELSLLANAGGLVLPNQRDEDENDDDPDSNASLRQMSSILPTNATPPDRLPGVIVRTYTLGMAILWMVSFIALIWTVATKDTDDDLAPATPMLSYLAANWPQPAALFQAQLLHCPEASNKVFVGGRFGLWETRWDLEHGNFSTLQEVSEASVDSVLCQEGAGDCYVMAENRLSRLGHAGTPTLEAALPSSWKKSVAAWTSADEAIFSGWDGHEVFVATSRLVQGSSPRVRVRFALRPTSRCKALFSRAKKSRVGRYLDALGFSKTHQPCRRKDQGNYTDVNGMHLTRGGQSLLVLYGQRFVDRWDLASGLLQGRWKLPEDKGPAVALCLRSGTSAREPHESMLIAFGEANPTLGVVHLASAAPDTSELSDAALDCGPAGKAHQEVHV